MIEFKKLSFIISCILYRHDKKYYFSNKKKKQFLL